MLWVVGRLLSIGFALTLSGPSRQQLGPHDTRVMPSRSAAAASHCGSQPVMAAVVRRRARRGKPKNVEVVQLFREAQRSLRNGAEDEARALFHRCLQLDAADGHTWLALARLEAQRATVEEGRALFERGRAACPGNVRIAHAQGVFEQRAGLPDRARSCFREAAALEPSNAYVAHSWGLLEEAVGNATAALEIYAETYGRRPQAEVCVAWASLEAHLGHIDRARELFSQGAQHEQRSGADGGGRVELLLAWADIERSAGNSSHARALLNSALERAPRSPKIHTAIAHLEAARGDEVAARAAFTAGAALSPHAVGEKTAEVFNAWASHEARRGELGRALAIVERGRRRHPRDPSLLQTLGTLHRRAGNTTAARASFEEAVRLRPHAPTFVAWGLMEADLGRFDTARQLFARGVRADPAHAPLHSARARVEERAGNLAEARRVLTEALAAFPSSTLWHGLGKLEERSGNLERAAELFEQGASCVRSGDDSSFLWHSLGMVRTQQRNLGEAVAAFERGLRRRPSSSQLRLGMAIAYGAMGKGEEARPLFLMAVQADPSHAHAWQAWGVMEARGGNTEVARDLFRRGLRRCPDHAALWQASAKLEGEAGETGRARRLFIAGEEACPDQPAIFLAHAYFEMHQGRTQEAARLIGLAQQMEPAGGELHHVAALNLIKRGKADEARQTVERGIELAPTHAPLHRLRGSLQDQAGEVEAARASFKEGLRLNPGYAQLYHAWARLEARVLNLEGMAEVNRRARQAFPQPGLEGT